jgi:ankyrin repeat protein
MDNEYIDGLVGAEFENEQQENEFFRNLIERYHGNTHFLELLKRVQRMRQKNRAQLKQKNEAAHIEHLRRMQEMERKQNAHTQRILDKAVEALSPPIIVASNKGDDSDIRTIILANMSCIDDVDKRGNTALHLAASRNALSTVKMLLLYGANTHIKNKEGKLAVDVSGWSELTECILNV